MESSLHERRNRGRVREFASKQAGPHTREHGADFLHDQAAREPPFQMRKGFQDVVNGWNFPEQITGK
jgi:hypothetical protein